MVNWLLGHTNRFKAFVSHAGVYDLRSMAGETEELWFPIWEFHGMPWENPETVCQVVAQLLRQGFQDTDAGDAWRTGLSRTGRPRHATLYRASVAEGTFEDRGLSR